MQTKPPASTCQIKNGPTMDRLRLFGLRQRDKTGASLRRRPKRWILPALRRTGLVTDATVLLRQQTACPVRTTLQAQLPPIGCQARPGFQKGLFGHFPMIGKSLNIGGRQVYIARPAAALTALSALEGYSPCATRTIRHAAPIIHPPAHRAILTAPGQYHHQVRR